MGDEITSLNLDELDVEALEQRLELGSLLAPIPDGVCGTNSCAAQKCTTQQCDSNGCFSQVCSTQAGTCFTLNCGGNYCTANVPICSSDLIVA